jgi:FtsZ-interacting cell division protein ZipA
VGINDKSFRLRGLRDRLHLAGKHAPTFNQSIDIIIEVLGLVHSRRNLSWCRKEARKLRDKSPDMTIEQLQRFAFLEDRMVRKDELIKNREERNKLKAAKRKKKALPESLEPQQQQQPSEPVAQPQQPPINVLEI